jgi:hypothetical protein
MGLGFRWRPVVGSATLLPILAAPAIALSGTEVMAQTELKVVGGGVLTSFHGCLWTSLRQPESRYSE